MPLLTPAEAAEELSISMKTLHRLTKEGRIPYINIGLGTEREARRYDRADMEAFIRENKIRMNPDAKRKVNGPTSGTEIIDIRGLRKSLLKRPPGTYDVAVLRAQVKRETAAKRKGGP